MADMFQQLHSEIIQHILCFMPIQEAARTSVLSSQWERHWTKMRVLVFDEDTFQVAGENELTDLEETYGDIESDRRRMTRRSRFFSAIYQTLLKHDAVMLEFTLRVVPDVTCVEIDHILSYLARKNTLEKLTLDMAYRLPKTIFMLQKLIHLHLSSCELTRRPEFNGFTRLTNLHMENVTTTTSSIMHLLSKCPSLKILNLVTNNVIADDDSNTRDLFDALAGIEYLSVSFSVIHTFAIGRAVPLPVSLPHLTYIYIYEMSFTATPGLSLLLFLIKSSPNLEKLRLLMSSGAVNDEDLDLAHVDGYDIRFPHLHSFEMDCVMDADAEMDFIHAVMTSSPILEHMRISVLLEEDLSDVQDTLFAYEDAPRDLTVGLYEE